VLHADILACSLDYHAEAVGSKPRVLTLPKADNKKRRDKQMYPITFMIGGQMASMAAQIIK
jgi:hypothetical protein